MKLIEHFNSFLEKEVNLDSARYKRAEQSINALSECIQNDKLIGSKLISITPQGSFRQKTIIRPSSEKKEFDVDLLIKIEVVDEWKASDYLNYFHNIFAENSVYKNKVDRVGKTRCITIDYEGDFHVDIVPCVESQGIDYVMNKNDNVFEPTDGDGYAQWFAEKNVVTGDENLIKAVRLIKYLRDIKGNFSVKSILLTTLLARQVQDYDDQAVYYTDLPTTLKTILNRLADFVQAHSTIPEVLNPVMPEEDFNRHWDQDKYNNFRDKIIFYNEKVNRAFDSTNEKESIKLWKEVFGDEFPDSAKGFLGQVIGTAKDAFSSLGDLILGDYSHRERPNWKEVLQHTTTIRAFVTGQANKRWEIKSDQGALRENWWLDYYAQTDTPKPFEVRWQVVNTGEHASSITGGLRGQITQPQDASNPLYQRERTEYTGKHWIECYIIKKGICVSRSGPFYIRVANQSRPKIPKRFRR